MFTLILIYVVVRYLETIDSEHAKTYALAGLILSIIVAVLVVDGGVHVYKLP